MESKDSPEYYLISAEEEFLIRSTIELKEGDILGRHEFYGQHILVGKKADKNIYSMILITNDMEDTISSKLFSKTQKWIRIRNAFIGEYTTHISGNFRRHPYFEYYDEECILTLIKE